MTPFPKALRRHDYVQEGVQPARSTVLLACSVGDDYDDPQGRIVLLRDETTLDFPWSEEGLVSIDAGTKGSGYALGENGTVARFDWRTPESSAALQASVQRIANPAVADLGPLRRLRLLGPDVVCAGSVGQVYRLGDKSFSTLVSLEVGGAALTIEDLAGKSASDFVAVTSDGDAAHFDGKRWRVLPLPRKVCLNGISLMTDGRYAICGNDGSVFIGADDSWHAMIPLDPERDYTGIASSAGVVYAAHCEGIDLYDGDASRPLAIAQRSRNEFVNLRSGIECVWSFAGRSVGQVTGETWQVVC